ncbi:hypothetical protein D3C87_1175090 [compost metagenome]
MLLRRHAGARFRLGAHEDHQFLLLVGNHLGHRFVDFLQGYLRQEFLRVQQFIGDAGDGFLLQEVARILGHETSRIGLVAFAVGALVIAQHVLARAVQLILAEAEAARPLIFQHQRIDSRLHAALAQQGIRAERFIAAHQLAHAAAALDERGISLLRQFLHARAEHLPVQVFDHLAAVVGDGDRLLRGADRVADEDTVVRRFLVRDHQRFRLRALRHFRIQPRARLRGIFQLAEMLADQLFSLFRLHITDHHHGHQVGTVPVFIETLDGFRLEGFQHGFLADRHAFRVARTVQQLRIQHLVHAVAGALAQARLFQHDAALAVDVGRVEFQAMRPVFQHEKTLFQVFLLVRRNRQHVDGFIETRVGVQVGAELHADRLQI